MEVYISSSMFVEIAFVLKRNNQLELLSDVYKLIQLIKEEAFKKLKLILELEVQLVGDFS